MTLAMEATKRYKCSKGLEQEFWLGLILAYYARITGSELADKAANEIYDRTENYMLTKYKHKLRK